MTYELIEESINYDGETKIRMRVGDEEVEFVGRSPGAAVLTMPVKAADSYLLFVAGCGDEWL